jgi:hypothetical protein
VLERPRHNRIQDTISVDLPNRRDGELRSEFIAPGKARFEHPLENLPLVLG